MEPGLQALLKTHAALLEYDAALDKVRCIQSGHTMPAVVRAVEQFVSGKKFMALRQKLAVRDALKQYEPHIVPSKYHTDKLFCRITGRLVAMNEEAVVQHSAGKRFQVCFAYAEAGQPLKEEQAPKAAPSEEEDSEPVWEPPAHMLAGDSDDDGGDAAEEAAEEEEELLGGDEDDGMDEEEEVLPLVARPNVAKRKAAAEPRLKKLHKHQIKKR